MCLLGAALGAGAAQAQEAVETGLRIMTDRSSGNCIACHSLPGPGNSGSNFAPALEHVGSRYDAERLRQWVVDARQINPDTLMPPFGSTQGTRQALRSAPMLSSEQIAQVVQALASWR